MSSAPTILVIEDNEDDLYFIRRTLKAVAPELLTRFAMDGREALQYLRGEDAFADRVKSPFPSLVFLDLKLPFVHGLDVLKAIRGDPALQALRVIVLTSSSEERDRSRAEQLGAQGYLVKPATRDMLAPILSGLKS